MRTSYILSALCGLLAVFALNTNSSAAEVAPQQTASNQECYALTGDPNVVGDEIQAFEQHKTSLAADDTLYVKFRAAHCHPDILLDELFSQWPEEALRNPDPDAYGYNMAPIVLEDSTYNYVAVCGYVSHLASYFIGVSNGLSQVDSTYDNGLLGTLTPEQLKTLHAKMDEANAEYNENMAMKKALDCELRPSGPADKAPFRTRK